MTQKLVQNLSRLTSVFVLLFATGLVSGQQPDPRLTKVFADWQDRQERLSTIRYRVHGETVFAKGSGTDDHGQRMNPASPDRDVIGNIQWEVLFDFSTQRHRWDKQEYSYLYSLKKLIPKFMISVSNGKIAQSHLPREKNASLAASPMEYDAEMGITRGSLRAVLFPAGSLPIFFGHGIVPLPLDRLYAGHLRRTYDPELLHVHGTGVHAGRQCLVLRTDTLRTAVSSYHEFWVDVERQSAVVRDASYVNDRVDNDYDVQYEKTSFGWMPLQWQNTVYTNGKTHVIHRLHVDERQASPAVTDADFRIETKPGMKIRDVRYEDVPNPLVTTAPAENTTYVVGEPGGLSEPLKGAEKWPIWLAWIPGGLLAVCLAGWLLRRRRKRGSVQPAK